MGSDEENLDELLKSIMPSEEKADSSESDNEETGAEAVPADFDLGNFASDDFTSDDFEIGNFASDDFSIDDFSIEDFGEAEPEESVVWEEDAEAVPAEETNALAEEAETANDLEALLASSDAVETSETASFGNEAADGSMAPEDMLALLESMTENTAESESAVSAEEGAVHREESAEEKVRKEKSKDEKKKKGMFSKLFFGKKNKEAKTDLETDSEAEQPVFEAAGWADGNERENGEEIFIPTEENLESLFDAASAAAQEEESSETGENEAAEKENQGGFFSKVFAFLTETDDESEEEMAKAHGMEPSDENKNILEELEKEDKKKKKKKVKGKRGQSEELSEDEDEDGEESAKGRKKGKKKKRRDKRSKGDSPEQIIRESVAVKKVSKKNIAIIAGLCLTITAVIVVLCSIVPGFFDKRKAREAYYQSDYNKAYELLYGRQLDNSDTIIFNKSKIILELDRKLKSYHNYMGIGKEVQALDALMAGVEKYPDILLRAEEYHVEAEVNAIYETILNILSDKYNISEPAAKVIIGYDDLTYTRKLESVVNGTPFEFAQEEDTAAVSDVLPEERAVIQREESAAAEEPEVTEEPAAAEEPEVTEEPAEESSVTEEEDEAEEEAAAVSEEMAEELPAASETEENSETTFEEELPAEETAGGGTPAEENNNIVPEENQTTDDSSAGSQGEMIQGIKQPIAVEIYGD